MKIAIIDGLGGGLGCQLIDRLSQELPRVELIALGTNSKATSRMLEAGADTGATGENAIRINVARVEIIVGPLGIIIPDAMMGEVTLNMARYISDSEAEKFILGIKQPHVNLVGLADNPLNDIIDGAVQKIKKYQQRE